MVRAVRPVQGRAARPIGSNAAESRLAGTTIPVSFGNRRRCGIAVFSFARRKPAQFAFQSASSRYHAAGYDVFYRVIHRLDADQVDVPITQWLWNQGGQHRPLFPKRSYGRLLKLDIHGDMCIKMNMAIL